MFHNKCWKDQKVQSYVFVNYSVSNNQYSVLLILLSYFKNKLKKINKSEVNKDIKKLFFILIEFYVYNYLLLKWRTYKFVIH